MTALFPGSFDPVTLGHIDLIKRGLQLFDHVIVAVLNNPAKAPLLTVQERIELLHKAVKGIQGVQVEAYSGMLAELARQRNVRYILRGVRSGADCDYEIPLAQANKKLDDGLETVLLVTDSTYSYMSAGLIREIAAAGYASGFDDKVLDQWVPLIVKDMLKSKYL